MYLMWIWKSIQCSTSDNMTSQILLLRIRLNLWEPESASLLQEKNIKSIPAWMWQKSWRWTGATGNWQTLRESYVSMIVIHCLIKGHTVCESVLWISFTHSQMWKFIIQQNRLNEILQTIMNNLLLRQGRKETVSLWTCYQSNNMGGLGIQIETRWVSFSRSLLSSRKAGNYGRKLRSHVRSIFTEMCTKYKSM